MKKLTVIHPSDVSMLLELDLVDRRQLTCKNIRNEVLNVHYGLLILINKNFENLYVNWNGIPAKAKLMT